MTISRIKTVRSRYINVIDAQCWLFVIFAIFLAQNWVSATKIEVNFFDRTNGLAARTKKRIAAKPLRILTLKWHLVDKIKFKWGFVK